MNVCDWEPWNWWCWCCRQMRSNMFKRNNLPSCLCQARTLSSKHCSIILFLTACPMHFASRAPALSHDCCLYTLGTAILIRIRAFLAARLPSCQGAIPWFLYRKVPHVTVDWPFQLPCAACTETKSHMPWPPLHRCPVLVQIVHAHVFPWSPKASSHESGSTSIWPPTIKAHLRALKHLKPGEFSMSQT